MDVQTATVVIAGISVIIGVINSILSNRRAEEQRDLQLFMGIYGRFHEEDFRRSMLEIGSMADFNELRQDEKDDLMKDKEVTIHVAKAFCYFEGVGALISRRLIDIDLVEDLMGNHITWVWEKLKPIAYELRKMIHPKEADAVERLYNTIQEKRQHEALINT